MQLLIASGNVHKLEEMRHLLCGVAVDVVGPGDLLLRLDVEETGSTYAENAEIKARAYARASGLAALADDSGLEVAALAGAPGLYSARFGGPGLTDEDRLRMLLKHLEATPLGARAARFRCSLSLVAPSGRTWQAEGRCDGSIATRPSGACGFGYDPVFIVAGVGRTMAELSADEKNRVSHRARAVAALRPGLNEWLSSNGG
jgi:XTP/dITP diphosphohydrolase